MTIHSKDDLVADGTVLVSVILKLSHEQLAALEPLRQQMQVLHNVGESSVTAFVMGQYMWGTGLPWDKLDAEDSLVVTVLDETASRDAAAAVQAAQDRWYKAPDKPVAQIATFEVEFDVDGPDFSLEDLV